MIDFLHFVDFGQFFVKVGLVGVDGFFAVGREMILKDIGCVTMISDGIESAKGFGGFDSANTLSGNKILGTKAPQQVISGSLEIRSWAFGLLG